MPPSCTINYLKSLCFFALIANFSLNAQNINQTWYASDNSYFLRFNESPLGNKFTYVKDTLRIIGNWAYDTQNPKQLVLTYKWRGMSIDSIEKMATSIAQTMSDTAKVANDSTNINHANSTLSQSKNSYTAALATTPLPSHINIAQISPTALSLHGNNGFAAELATKPQSTLDSILNNNILRGIIGIFSLVSICYLFSRNRKAIDWRTVGAAIALQGIFAILVLKVKFVRVGFEFISSFFVAILGYTRAGSEFLFSGLITRMDSVGYIFAFQVLPTVVFFSALSSLLYYIGVLQKIVGAFSWVMSRVMRLSGAESLSAAANIFMGQTEAPLLIKPYVPNMTRSEILCVMVGGMATIAGGVFAAYVGFLGGSDPEKQLIFATHLLTASIMSAPAAIMASKILLPETQTVKEDSEISSEKMGENLLDAIANGTTEGLKLAVNVGAMLLVFIALMAMFNSILFDIVGKYTGLNELIKGWTNGAYSGLRLEFIFGLIGAPLAWLIGTPTEDIMAIGRLLGEKTIINEFVAYTSLGTMKDTGDVINQKSIIIAIYALCGFSNFGSIGIQIGGIGSLAPNQRPTIASLGLLALLGGTVACLMTAVIAGMLY
jgi:CNT family concentrative nucleoside transporter